MRLLTGKLEVIVRPDVGGKVEQILWRPSQTPILIPARAPLRTLPPGSQWIDFDTSGMDDCFPNVDIGPYPSASDEPILLPQLGEWVYGEWPVLASGDTWIHMSRHSTRLPYQASKKVSLVNESTLRLDYHVHNHGPEPLSYLWSAHPLFAVADTFHLQLPHAPHPLTAFPDEGTTSVWPHWQGTDLSHQWIAAGTTVKLFAQLATHGDCLLHTNGLCLRIRADWTQTPILGLWFNHFGFPRQTPPFRAIAIEPCTAPTDLLSECGNYHRQIAAGASAQWWMEIAVEASAA